MSLGSKKVQFNIGDVVREAGGGMGSPTFTVTRATYKKTDFFNREVWFIDGFWSHDPSYIVTGQWTERFKLVRLAMPTNPVKISSLPTEGMDLKDVLDRWEKLNAAGLIIKED